MVKGPLHVTDMVCWHVGMGMGLYGVRAAARSASRNRQRIPRFFHLDDQGVPDVHAARALGPRVRPASAGNPTTFDYGRMRETWLIHLCTDWMGDDAWLWKLDCEFRRFNYVGDLHTCTGTVTRKYLADGDRPAVDLELAATNQRGRDDHARPRHDPAAESASTARSGCPTRPAARPTSQISLDRRRRAIRATGDAPMTYSSVAGLAPSCGAVLRLTLDRADKRNALNDG